MKSFRIFDHRARRLFVAVGLLLATVATAVAPVLVSAAQVTERSIALSSSSKAATGVNYTVNFTAPAAAGAFVVDFCENSPILGQACDAPAGFDVDEPTSATSGFTDVEELDANTLRVVGTIGLGADVSVVIEGITNPTNAGPLYARIATYASEAHAEGYTSANPNAVGARIDEGGVAISITDTVGVSGAVLESLTFCVADESITANCGNANSSTAPVIKIGETVGSTVALDAAAVSTGNIYTQVSTNAVGGAVIRLKSGTACGGLKRVEATACDITPALTGGVAVGQAKFGVRAAAIADTGTNPTGTFQVVDGSNYNDTTYALNYLANNSTGITSPFGDPFLDTDDGPANNKNMRLTFGASISNSTPAGLYSTDLSLIATGKF